MFSRLAYADILLFRMDYEQVYIDTLWKELEILPEEETGDFRIDGNHLHIWPRKDFMFIAIPSPVRPQYGAFPSGK